MKNFATMTRQENETFIKLSVLLIPSFVLVCADSITAWVAAIIWGVAAYKIAKKWNSKAVRRLARLRSVRRLLDD